MKSIYFVLLLTVSFASYAQDRKWEWLNPKVNGNAVNNISVLQDQKTIIISYDSNLLVSHDKGLLWNSVPVNYRANKVFALSSSLSFMTSLGGEIVKNVLAGTPETVFQKSAQSAQFNDMQMDSVTGVGLAVGGYDVLEPLGDGSSLDHYWGIIARTTDFGEHWDVVYEQDGDKLNGLTRHGNSYMAFGVNRTNFVVDSEDGITWTINTAFGYPGYVIRGLAFVNDTLGFLVYQNNGSLYSSNDAGASWTIKKNINSAIYTLTASGSTLVVAAQDSIFVSDDLGATWVTRKVIAGGLSVQQAENQGKLIALMDQANGVYVSKDDSHLFVNVNDNLDRNISPGGYYVLSTNQMTFTSEKIGYLPITGSDGYSRLMKTTDGGCRWSFQPNFTGSYRASIYFTDDNTGFATSNANLFKTTDGGTTWANVGLLSTDGDIFGKLAFFTPLVGVTFTSDGGIYKTTNGGVTWTQVVESGLDVSATLSIVNETTAFTASADKILVTTDAGSSWTQTTTGFGLNWYGIHFFDNQNGLLAGWQVFSAGNNFITKRYLIRTSDGGTSWTKVIDLPGNPTGMKFFDATHGYILGQSGMLMETNDGGATWTLEKTILTQDLNDIFDFGESVYITGLYHSAIKTTTGQPIAAFTIPSVICQGDSLISTNQSTDAESYLWQIDGQVASSVENLKMPVSLVGLHSITLTSGTCQFTYFNSIEKSLTVNPTPDKPVLMINNKIALPSNKLCDSTYTITTQPSFLYHWSDGNSDPNVVITNETFLSLRVTNEEGCSALSDTISFVRIPLPKADFTTRYAYPPAHMEFQSESTHADSVWWLLSDGATSQQTDWSHTFADTTRIFSVRLVAGNYCGRDTLSKDINYVVLGIPEKQPTEVNVYPNPVRSSGTVFVAGQVFSKYSIGAVTGTSVVQISPLENTSITLPYLASGVYCLFLYGNGNEVAIRKLIVTD